MAKDKIGLYITIFIGIMIVLAVLGFSASTIDKVGSLLVPILISLILSAIIGMMIESLGGSFLKAIVIPIEIYGIRFSISAFVIAVILLKLWIF
ncbi:MAG: hypothetical protein Q8N63_03260 [Nanoarchaeota archaeon]|nr:hypothetical protein [Nanoarchaeota archaeon]